MPGESQQLLRVPSEIPGLDEILGGGISHGRSTLVAGTSGSGKTVLALQSLALGIARSGETGVLVSFEEPPLELARNVASLGFGVAGLIDAGRLVVIDFSPPADVGAEVGEYELGGLLARLEHAITVGGATRVVLDSITAFFAQFADSALVRRELHHLTDRLRELEVTTLITAERVEEYGAVARNGVEEFIADSVIILRNPLERERRRRSIEILKLRGGGHERGEFPFGIDVRKGVVVNPLAALDASLDRPAGRRSWGNVTLDEMTGGGLFSDAFALVLGPSGAGKTLTALQFLDAGVEAGERGLLYTFDESSAQVSRNAAAWGFDLETPSSDGRLSVIARYPERLSLEDLLIDIARELEAGQPSRIAIDSLSVLNRVSSGKSFREFVVALRSLVKAHSVTAVLTYDSACDPRGTRPELSTMTDAILELGYLEAPGAVKRWLTVAKLRGSTHDLGVREYRITDEGMVVLDPLQEPVGLFG